MSQPVTPNDDGESTMSDSSFTSSTEEKVEIQPALRKDSESNLSSRVERKDFPSTITKSHSEVSMRGKAASATPKNLRFRMISPSNSNASTSSFAEQIHPVIVKPLAPPTPVIVRPSASGHMYDKPQRKQSFIATVTVNGNEGTLSSSSDNYLVTGNPTQIEFLEGSSTGSGSTTTSSSSFNSQNTTLMAVPMYPETPDNIIVLPASGRTHVNTFVHAERPKPGLDYFSFQFPPNKKAVGVVIPFFNEEERELRRTLESLEAQSKIVWKHKNLAMHVLLIMDGWAKASDTMREYMKFMFPPANPKLPWWEAVEDKTCNDVIETFFVQRIKPYGKKKSKKCISLSEVKITPGQDSTVKERKLFITLIVKRDNRRKHNSHEWFFGNNGFAEFYKHEYLFATDCGTLFEDDCLYSLISYMERNPTTSVATGRQRVMTKAQQGSNESIISLATMYRLAQCYDYESSFACFMGAFALFGFLPVIPGPCGLYRAADILGKARDWYFDVVNTDPDKSGMVLGNLRIAEDRVLSYAAVLKTEEPRKMALIPESTFYFEAETQLEKFLLQRRRWTNGTVAGYIYMVIQNPGLLFGAKMNPIRKLIVYFLLLCQLLVYLIVALSPAIFLTSLHATLRSIFPSDKFKQTFPDIAWYCCVGLYVTMVIVHTKTKYRAWMFYLLLLVSAVTITGAFYTYGAYIAKNGLPFNSDNGTYQYLSIWIVACITVFPLVIAFLHSPKSFLLMIISVIPYYLFLPTLVGWFSAYAFARTWDLTWGNRPASAEHASGSAQTKANVEHELKTKAMTVCIFVMIFNGIFLLISEQFLQNAMAVLAIGIFIFSFAALQMVLSSIYFILYYDPRRILQTMWRMARYPFVKKKVYVTESSEEEEEVDDYKATTNSSLKPTRSSDVKRTDSSSSGKPKRAASGVNPLKNTRSQSMIDIKHTKSSSASDKAEVVTEKAGTEMKFGQVKRTPSVATAV